MRLDDLPEEDKMLLAKAQIHVCGEGMSDQVLQVILKHLRRMAKERRNKRWTAKI